MLAPLAAGPHTIHFTGTIGAPVNFTLEITYHLTVAPAGSSVESGASLAGQATPPPGAVPGALRTSWGRLKAIYR